MMLNTTDRDISNKKGILLEYLNPLADSSLTENKEKNQKEDGSRIEMDSISIVQSECIDMKSSYSQIVSSEVQFSSIEVQVQVQ
ncbi:hypothetical protein F8M41_024404 [Gigaspora margarita]|uniref:Uncharacterized protein n=1 Tax=Gigaspora margarita TaxID=4874 RepID=A0A8H3XL36_GIGMA|nr:hypothetical protein F8M41_024404 [Gigaspora margarita]